MKNPRFFNARWPTEEEGTLSRSEKMPELPDVIVYLEALEQRFLNQTIGKIQLRSPFLVRTFEPDLFSAEGRRIVAFSRMGKRIVWELQDELFLVFHLMIAGRYHLRKLGSKATGKNDLVAFTFADCVMMMTEASSKKRASLHVVQGEKSLRELDPSGLEILEADVGAFAERLKLRNHTLKRALTSPKLFSGIGNAYSDEILHAARLSPMKQTQRLNDEEVERLFAAVQDVMRLWIERHRAKAMDKFPEKVTAFHDQMAVHGKYKQPCPVCKSPVQRIVYAENETNYCAACQTGGKVLADRSLSRLLKEDWPRTIEAWDDL